MAATQYRIFFSFIVIVLTILGRVTIASADKRVALVIGNSVYEHVSRLPNPQNDAASIAASLKRIGFETVIKKDDLPLHKFTRALRDFAALASTADVAVVFFAGHGMEVDKVNYLVPTDAELKSDRDVLYETVPLDQVIHAVEGARRMRLVILDACRDNPFVQSMKRSSTSRSIGRGLSIVEPDQGDTLVAFAAKAGSTADDGKSSNSPYTRALLTHLERPGLEINKLFRNVRDQVLRETGRRQEPFTYGSLSSNDFYFLPPDTSAPRANPQTQPSTPAPKTQGVDPHQIELAFWNSIQNSMDISDYKDYLAQFSQGIFASIARRKIQQLEAKPQKSAKRDWTQMLAHMQEVKNKQPEHFAMAKVPELAKAARFLPEAVKDGIAQAQYLLGYCYYHGGCGYGPNYEEAFRLFKISAEQGYADAQAALGDLYAFEETMLDYQEALLWFRRAAKQGNAHALNSLGYMYENGRGVDQDYTEAASYYHRASEAGNTGAMYSLGRFYDTGKGVPKNGSQAATFFLEAAKSGEFTSQTTLLDENIAEHYSLEMREAVQMLLRSRGFYFGAIDGKFGPETWKALRSYFDS